MSVVFDPKQILKNLPNLPGVYRMIDNSGGVLYVGKAINLKRRVSSYFQKADLSPRIQLMVKQIRAIETTVTRSEAEALLLENNLIKALSPRYNILFRDDKSYPYLMISGHQWPRIAYFRGVLDKQNQYFGPYPNSYAVRNSIQILQKVFRLRTCEDSIFANRSRPCLLFQIKRCSAPCISAISHSDYTQSVKDAVQFLQGKQQILIKTLIEKMHTASQNLAFERAAGIRDQIQVLSKMQEQQFVTSNGKNTDADVIALVQHNELVCINMVMIRGGHHLGDKSFFPLNANPDHSEENMEAFIAQRYLGADLPDILIYNIKISDTLRQSLLEQKRITLVTQPQREKKIWLKMAEKNAELAIEQKLVSSTTQHKRLLALRDMLAIQDIERLECFDISHTQGEATIASCVVYDHETMQQTEYRRYNITQAKGGDDYAAMKEVLFRRYEKMALGEGKKTDVVVIDGGKGQIAMAQAVLNEVGIELPIIGISKGEGRKPGLDSLHIPHLNKTLQLKADHPALLLIQTIRDEAHRFAISGHRAKRSKARTVSVLEDISGVGVKRRQRLLTRFGGLKGIVAASVEDLAKVDGVSRTLAEKIYNALH